MNLVSITLVIIFASPMFICAESDAVEEPINYTAQWAWIGSYPEENVPLYQMMGYYNPDYQDFTWTGYDTVFVEEVYMNDDGRYVYHIRDPGLTENGWLWRYLDALSWASHYGILQIGFDLIEIDFETRELRMVFDVTWEDLYIATSGYTFVPTRFMVDGEVFWSIAEVAEAYEDGNYDLYVPTPTKDGYVFTGWYEDSSCSVPWTCMSIEDWKIMYNDGIENIFPELNRFIYAGWEPDPSAIPDLEFTSDPSDGDIEYVGL